MDKTIYFVTFNTFSRIKYFSEPAFCEVFIANLKLVKAFYKFELYSFVILPDHVHLLFMPHKAKELSKIIQFIKRNTSRNINFVIGYNTEGAINESHLRLGYKYICCKNKIIKHYKYLYILRKKFIDKYGEKQNIFPKFRWQKSFYDHYIRNKKDFNQHLDYIYKNPIKHKIENPKNYQFIFTNYSNLCLPN